MITYTTDPSRWEAAKALLISWPGLMILVIILVSLISLCFEVKQAEWMPEDGE